MMKTDQMSDLRYARNMCVDFIQHVCIQMTFYALLILGVAQFVKKQ